MVETSLVPDNAIQKLTLTGVPINAPVAPHTKSLTEKLPDLLPLGDAVDESKLKTSPDEGGREFISKGEKIHKWASYLGIDWVFNTAAGVTFAYWGNHTKLGKQIWSGPLTEGFTALLKPLFKNPESLKASVGKGNLFMSIIAGGMFTIPPLMMLERNETRRDITKWIDEKIYGKDIVANEPKFAKAYDEILHEPKKDFASGMLSRGAALAPLLGIVMFAPTRKLSDKFYFNHVAKVSEGAANLIGFTAENSFKSVSPALANERWKFIHDGIAMDFGLGVPYAVLHAFFYEKFAAFLEKPKPKLQEAPSEITAEAAILEPATVTQTPWASKAAPSEKHALSQKHYSNFAEQVCDKNATESLSL